MAQSRQRRKQVVNQRSSRPRVERMQHSPRAIRLRRIVIVLFVLLGLAGILAVSPSDSGDGAPPAVRSDGRLRADR